MNEQKAGADWLNRGICRFGSESELSPWRERGKLSPPKVKVGTVEWVLHLQDQQWWHLSWDGLGLTLKRGIMCSALCLSHEPLQTLSVLCAKGDSDARPCECAGGLDSEYCTSSSEVSPS